LLPERGRQSPKRFDASKREIDILSASSVSASATSGPVAKSGAPTPGLATGATVVVRKVLRSPSPDMLSRTLPHYSALQHHVGRVPHRREPSLDPVPRRGRAANAPARPASSVPPSEREHLERTITGLSLARELQNSDIWRFAPPPGPPPGPPVALIHLNRPFRDELECSLTQAPQLRLSSPRQQTVPYVRPSPTMERSAHSYVPPPTCLTRGPSFIPIVMSASYVPAPSRSRSYVPPPVSMKILSQSVTPMIILSPQASSMSAPPTAQAGSSVQFLAGLKPPSSLGGSIAAVSGGIR
jgi:hypothetical protein